MRRRLGSYFPIMLLALLMQLLTPVAAIQTVTALAADPFGQASICSTHAGATGEQRAPTGNSQADHACCAFCSGGGTGAVAVDPPKAFTAIQRDYQRVAWLSDIETLPARHVVFSAQARAPPTFS